MKKFNIFETSLKDFVNRIVQKWNKNKFKFHKGHVNILQYAYFNSIYWAASKGFKPAVQLRFYFD